MRLTAFLTLLATCFSVEATFRPPTFARSPEVHAPPAARAADADSDALKFGNFYNYWLKTDAGWDLTRGVNNNSITLDVGGTKSPITIAPESSALVIIDMQNFFLHPDLNPQSGGRDVVPTTLQMVDAFRANGMKVLWVQWGLTDMDLITIPPSFLWSFSSGTPNTTFGSDMGIINGTEAGPLLMRGSWNAEAWGPLFPSQQAGIANGTDFFFNKNRLSGLWGAQTPLGIFLEDNSITTLFFGGVNIDQCVWGTLLDAFYKGYDTILVEDIAATTSPEYASLMTYYNGALDGWTTNSSNILSNL